MKIQDIIEAFSDLGKLSPDELKKGQRLDPNDNTNFKQVSGRIFHQAITQIQSNDIERANKGLPSKGLNTLSTYSPSQYNSMKCYLGKNNSSGYCINGDELVSVFSSQGGSANAIMTDAVKNGAKRLDCFAIRDPKTNKIRGPLFKLYSSHGFKIDTNMNSGKEGEPYSVQNGVSSFVDDNGKVHPENPKVVVFMVR